MGFIKDKKGQWAHPGKNTLIPDANGRITMKGVNQPVLGIDDEGNQEVMMPGGEYQFPGNDVYEIPLPKFQGPLRLGEVSGKVKLASGYDDLFKVDLPVAFRNAITTSFNVTEGIGGKYKFADFDKSRINNFNLWQNSLEPSLSGSGSNYELGVLNTQNKGLQLNKKGKLNLNNAYNWVNGIQTPLTKELMTQTLDEFSYNGKFANGELVPPPKTIDFDLFKESVNSKLATYKHSLDTEHATVGLSRLGYTLENKKSVFPEGHIPQNQAEHNLMNQEALEANKKDKVVSNIIDNQSVLFTSEGLGPNTATGVNSVTGAYHFQAPKLYGHMRYFNHADDPLIMYILELQSDEMQYYHKIGKSIKDLTFKNQNYERLINGEEELVAAETFNRMWGSASSPGGPLGVVGGEGGITATSKFPLVTNLIRGVDYSGSGKIGSMVPYSTQMGPKTWEETKFPLNVHNDTENIVFRNYDEVLRYRQQFIDNEIASFYSTPVKTGEPLNLTDEVIQPINTDDHILNWQNHILNNEVKINDLTIATTTDPSLLSSDQLLRNLQKKKLEKNQMQRLWDESVIYAVNNGYQEIAFPMSETVAKVQGYNGAKDHEVLDQPWTQRKEEDFYKSMWRLTSGTNYTNAQNENMIRNYGDFFFVPPGFQTSAEPKNIQILTNRYEVGFNSGATDFVPTGFEVRTVSVDVPANTKTGLYKKEADGTWTMLEHPMQEYVSVGGGGVASKNPNWTGKEWENSFRGITMNINEATKSANDPSITQEFIKDPITGNLIPKVQPPRFKDHEKNVYDIIKPIRDENHKVLQDMTQFRISDYKDGHQKILGKYTEEEFQNYIYKSFGKDHPYRIGTDPRGNRFFYVKPPENWYKGDIPMDIKAKGGEILPKYQDKGEVDNEVKVNYDDVEKGIRHIESLDGVLMKNKESSASGLYGQLFDDIDYDGTRDEFIADLEYQKELFNKRYNGQIEGVPGLEINGIELYNEYKDQIDNFTITPTEIAALSNMLGRQGTRNYLGLVLRDGMTLEEGVPSAYGPDKPSNKTPDEFFKLFNDSLQKKKVGGEMRDEVISDMLENGAFLPKFKMGAEMNLEGVIGKYLIKKNYDETHRLPYIQFNSTDGKVRDNRVYYDGDDVDGTDSFNIIDLESQIMHQDREHERVKQIIRKYDKGEKLSPTEEKHLIEIGLLENKTLPVIDAIPVHADIDFNTPINIDEVNVKKDLYNKTDGNKKGLTLVKQIEIYDAHINDIYRGEDKSLKVKKMYDKLNSLYYNDAKSSGMTVFDYIKSLNN